MLGPDVDSVGWEPPSINLYHPNRTTRRPVGRKGPEDAPAVGARGIPWKRGQEYKDDEGDDESCGPEQAPPLKILGW